MKFGVKTKWYHRIVLPAHKHKHNYTSIIIHSNDPLFLVCCISFSMIISLVYAHRRSFSHIFYWLHIIFAINVPRMDLKNYWIWCDYMILAHIVDHVCGCLAAVNWWTTAEIRITPNENRIKIQIQQKKKKKKRIIACVCVQLMASAAFCYVCRARVMCSLFRMEFNCVRASQLHMICGASAST